MNSTAGNHPYRQSHDDTIDERLNDQDYATWFIAQREYSDEPNAARFPQTSYQPRNSVPRSPVSSISGRSDVASRSASFSNEAQPSFAEFAEKISQQSVPAQPKWWSRLLADSWTIELVAVFVSFAAIASIAGVLWGYDQKPVPPLRKGITLNAVISSLATVSRTAIMLCIGTVLSQGKWLWFKKERSLMDLQNIEGASRGPLGSLLMLFSFRGGAVPYLAAFLTIAALGFDTFIQQLLITENRIVPEAANGISINSTTSMTANITAAMDYPESLTQLTAAMLANVQQQYQPMDVMAASVVDRRVRREEVDATTQTLASPIKADCPSGNCVWTPYYTLDICTQCQTTTEELSIKNLSPNSSDLSAMVAAAQRGNMSGGDGQTSSFVWEIIPKFGQRWKVPSNLSSFVDASGMDGEPEQLEVHASIVQKVVWPLNFASSDGFDLDVRGWTKQSFAGIDQPVAAIGFAEFKIDGNGVPVLNNSQECAITYCVREYNTSVVQGGLILNKLSTHYGTIAGDPNSVLGLGWSAEINGTNFTVGPLMYGIGVGIIAGYVLGNTTHKYMGTCRFSSSNNNNGSCSAPSVTTNDGVIEAISTDAWQGIDLTPDFTTVLDNANTVMSQIMQRYGNVSIVGDNAVTKTFVIVRWAWITLPAAVVFLGMVSFALTVWETSRMQAPSWKASLLPLLYRYVHVDDDDGSAATEERNNNTAVVAGLGTGIRAETALGNPPNELENWFVGSNLVSEFQVEAQATATRLARNASETQMWQLQSFETVQK